MPQALPANPDLDWLKKTARQRLVQLRSGQPDAKLHQALLAVAHDYGFKSWRALKSHVDRIGPTARDHDRVFKAAQAGDVEAVLRAFASGFDPATPDAFGRTVHQIAKHYGHEAIEVLARNLQGGKTRPDEEMQAIQAIMRAAQSGDLDACARVLTLIPSGSTRSAADSRRPRRCIWRFCATNMPPYAC
ncbi:hypothetical protein [Bradyrhizobium sp.]|uniref:hypothetical protein n=1 Tax=Bradyrhizobium sp. TaxID=376 RepID=UPI003C667646